MPLSEFCLRPVVEAQERQLLVFVPFRLYGIWGKAI
jgi:hypothetical protein